MTQTRQILISIILFYALLFLSCSRSEYSHRPSNQETNNKPRRWPHYQSEDSVLWALCGRLFQNYLRDAVFAKRKISSIPDTITEAEKQKGSYSTFNGVQIYSDSVLKQFGLRMGMPPSPLIDKLGKPDLTSAETSNQSRLSYQLHGEFGDCDKIVFYFKSDSLFKTVYYFAAPCD